MDAQETRRLTEGCLVLDELSERWPWTAWIVRLALAVALAVGLVLQQWRVGQVVVTLSGSACSFALYVERRAGGDNG